MSDDGSEVVRRPGVLGDLSAGLRALAESGIDPNDSAAGSAAALSNARPAPPLPSLSRPLAEVNRRPPSAEGLAVADRILAAAGVVHRSSASVTPLVPQPEHAAPATPAMPPPSPRPSDATLTGYEEPSSRRGGDATVLPSTATVVGPAKEQFRLEEGDALVIGRSPGDGGLAIDNFEVSRRHVRVEMRLGQLLAVDLGSTNGTSVVSGAMVLELKPQVATPLSSGDQLVVNGDVLLCTVTHLEGRS